MGERFAHGGEHAEPTDRHSAAAAVLVSMAGLNCIRRISRVSRPIESVVEHVADATPRAA